MWYLQKTINIAAGHHLKNYNGPCATPHGHNYNVTVYCRAHELDKVGMVIDFRDIKKIVKEYDHIDICTLPEFAYKGDEFTRETNATAENIAKHIYHKVPYCYKVDVEETPGSIITYTEE